MKPGNQHTFFIHPLSFPVSVLSQSGIHHYCDQVSDLKSQISRKVHGNTFGQGHTPAFQNLWPEVAQQSSKPETNKPCLC